MTPQEKAAALKARTAKNDHVYKNCFDSGDGKIVLKDLQRYFRFHDSSIVKGDPYATHANEGAREVVLYILKRIERAENNSEGMDE